MSLYRFVRLTALLTLARRYRARLLRVVFAVVFAWVTAWQYADVAAYLDRHRPEWSGMALILKTLIVYAALFLALWDLGRMFHGDDGQATPARSGRKNAPAKPAASPVPPVSRLEELAEKPRLRSRRDGILDESVTTAQSAAKAKSTTGKPPAS